MRRASQQAFRITIAPLAFTLTVLLCRPLLAQSVADRFTQFDKDGDGKLSTSEAGTLGFFKPADANRDGFVTLEEAEAFAKNSLVPTVSRPDRNAGMEGDGAAAVFHWPVKPIKISDSKRPVQSLDTHAYDGRNLRAWWRKPADEGSYPAIVYIHGGLKQFPDESLRLHVKDNPIITRFLSKGYAVVMATVRTYEQDVQSHGPIKDVRAILRKTGTLPQVDPHRIELYGGSGGGSIALELGGDPEVSAIIAGEPATVRYTGMLTTGEYGPRLEMMAGDQHYLAAAQRAGDWAISRPLVSNWNYNAFSVGLLARLAKVTQADHKAKYLEVAVKKAEVGVLPGQMESGRWFDAHNACAVYHNILMRELLELLHVLPKDHTFRPTLLDAVNRGLNQSAEETLQQGYTGTWTDNFARGLLWVGENETWRDALNVNLNASGRNGAPTAGFAILAVLELFQKQESKP